MGKGLIPADIETWKLRRKGLMLHFMPCLLFLKIDDMLKYLTLSTYGRES